jgi:ATP-binding protein involved in chromosome partitioning
LARADAQEFVRAATARVRGGGLSVVALDTELLGRIPIDTRLLEGSDAGVPLVASHPDVPAAKAIIQIAEQLSAKARSIVGRSLPLSVS